jgi:hypothetical protein
MSALDTHDLKSRNAAVPRRFERHLRIRWWRPDWLAEAAGFETLHFRIGVRQDSQLGAGAFEHAHLD